MAARQDAAGADRQAVPVAPPPLARFGLDRFSPYLMNRIMGRYNAQMRDRLAALGLTTTKARVLAVLEVHDGLMVNDLAVYCVVELSTMSRTITAMANEGLLRREEDVSDSRARRIFVTPQGRAVFEAIWPTMHDASESLFAGVSEAERDRFVTTLQKILGNIRVHPF